MAVVAALEGAFPTGESAMAPIAWAMMVVVSGRVQCWPMLDSDVLDDGGVGQHLRWCSRPLEEAVTEAKMKKQRATSN